MKDSSWLQLVAGPDYLLTLAGDVLPVNPPRMDTAVTIAAGFHRRAVVWVHESAHDAWGIGGDPKRLSEHVTLPEDAFSSPGWVRLSRELHVALPRFSGDFEGTATPADLARAIGLWREHVGDDFLFSAPATALHLISVRFTGAHRPSTPAPVPFAQSLYAIPATTWHRPLDADERSLPCVQLFDRRGSYLAAWRSAELPDGDWSELGPFDWHGAKWAPGYYLMDLSPLRAYVNGLGLHDPFARAPYNGDLAAHLSTKTWITEPLAVLAGELSEEAGLELSVERAVIAMRRVRPLDHVGTRLAEARAALEASDDPTAAVVLALVKDAYTRGTAHFEYGRRAPHPLHRPEWRHTVIDRHVANTWRSLRRATRRPFLVGGVDAALFAVSGPDDAPDGLRLGPELGSWKRRGPTAPLSIAAGDLGQREARDLLFGLMDAA